MGLDNRRQRRGLYEPYGCTTGHSFMTTQQRKDMASTNANFKTIWTKIVEQSYYAKLFMFVLDHQPVDVTSRPFLNFRYFYRAGSEETYPVKDIAVFKLDSLQLNQDGWLSDRPKIQPQFGRCATESTASANSISEEVTDVVKIYSGSELKKYIGRKIMCLGRAGLICPTPMIEDNGWVYGAHIGFKLDQGLK